MHAVERIAYWPRSQYGHAVHAAVVCAAPGTRKLVCADGENATSARRISGEGEPQRPRANDARGWAEPARPAQQLAVPIEFVAVLDEGRPKAVPRRASGRHRHH